MLLDWRSQRRMIMTVIGSSSWEGCTLSAAWFNGGVGVLCALVAISMNFRMLVKTLSLNQYTLFFFNVLIAWVCIM